MPSLREIQMRFANALLGDDADADAVGLVDGRLSGAQRLRVYRNSVDATLSNALRNCYPVVETLVGAEFFGFLSRHYLRVMPSLAGDVREYGAELPDFIAGFPALAALPYLADVARLEWALQEAYYAAEPLRSDLDELAYVAPARYGELRFKLHPSARIVTSPYPVLQIWFAHQPGADPATVIDLAAGGACVLVIRRNYAIELEPLGLGEQVLLESLNGGSGCASACESALRADPTLDLAAVLRTHIARRTFAGFGY